MNYSIQEPDWASPDRITPLNSRSASLSSTAAKIVQAAGTIAWMALALTAILYVYGPTAAWLDHAQSSTPTPSLWFEPDTWIKKVFFVPVLAGALVTSLRMQVINKLVALALLLAALVIASAFATRSYIVVMNDQVLIHPTLPWRADVRFSLAKATVTARGCRLWHSKSSTHHEIVFRVSDAGSGASVDLGKAAGQNLSAWLQVMRDYGDDSLPLAPAARDNAPHDDECMRYWLDGINPQQQAELNHLLT